ncbi:unnamed protein product [Thlaspi arvense]|uniref:Uncharacterized protein n=1 Tax=Thlaspi arvense TaxID=13288 RepID=A0AAU9SWW7_THLAR|nr:unnamed protein product [Thlaspi arvense]
MNNSATTNEEGAMKKEGDYHTVKVSDLFSWPGTTNHEEILRRDEERVKHLQSMFAEEQTRLRESKDVTDVAVKK